MSGDTKITNSSSPGTNVGISSSIGGVRISWIIGAVLIITGLYLVLWGKNEERKFGAAAQKAPIQSPVDQVENGAAGHIKNSITQSTEMFDQQKA
ncbi:hypothetical protein OROGR_026352 [Orobanche gracilis]